MKNVLDNKIDYLNISSKLEQKLNENNIYYIKDLWLLKRADLKKFLNDKEVTDIIIKLQLSGLDLNKKVYKNN